MRRVLFAILGAAFAVSATEASAQNVLRAEPLVLAPYEIVLVDDATCSKGQILRVTGAIRGLRRRKACIVTEGVQSFVEASR